MAKPVTSDAVANLLSQMIAIPSINPDYRRDEPPEWFGEARLARFVGDWLAQAGAEVEFQEVEPGRPNVMARIGARRARRMIWEGHLDTVQVAGKTGTTNNYKDAWFCGFTSNYVGAVWFGNDDDSSMKEMTGGALPAMTWHDIMAFAHQNIAVRPGYGIEGGAGTAVASATASGGSVQVLSPLRPAVLSPKTVSIIGSIGQMTGDRGRSEARAGEPDQVAGNSPVPAVSLSNGRFSVQ